MLKLRNYLSRLVAERVEAEHREARQCKCWLHESETIVIVIAADE